MGWEEVAHVSSGSRREGKRRAYALPSVAWPSCRLTGQYGTGGRKKKGGGADQVRNLLCGGLHEHHRSLLIWVYPTLFSEAVPWLRRQKRGKRTRWKAKIGCHKSRERGWIYPGRLAALSSHISAFTQELAQWRWIDNVLFGEISLQANLELSTIQYSVVKK